MDISIHIEFGINDVFYSAYYTNYKCENRIEQIRHSQLALVWPKVRRK